MSRYFVLVFCLGVTVSPVLSLDCCIPELTEQIKQMKVEGLLEQKQSYVNFDGCVLSVEDAARLKSVVSQFLDKVLKVAVEYNSGAAGVTRSYNVEKIDNYTYKQTGEDPDVSFEVYSIYTSSSYTIEYGCINSPTSPNSERCGDKTHFVQCAFPEGATKEDYESCQQRLDAVVGPYIKTKIIC